MSNEFDWDDFEVVSEEDGFEGFTVIEDVWDGFEVVKEDLLPQPFFQTQPNTPVEEAPSNSFTNPSLDLSGKTVEEQEGVTLYSQEDRDAKEEEEFWKNASFAEKIARADKDRKDNNTQSVDRGMLDTYKGEINAARNSNPKAYEKLSDKEVLDALQARGAAELGVDVATLPVALGKTVLGTMIKTAALSTGSEIAGQIQEANHGVEKTEEEKQDEAKRAAAIGGAFGLGGKVVEGAAGSLAKLWDKANGTEALEKLSNIGKSTKQFENTRGRGSPDNKDHLVGEGISADDVITARNDVSNLLKMNDSGAKLGTQSLSRATENPEIQKLLKQASTKTEKLIKAVPGEGNVFKEKILENAGLRAKNLNTDRANALRKSAQKVDNDLDDVIGLVSKDVKDGAISKDVLSDTKMFVKHLKSARSASKVGNSVKYQKQLGAAEEKLAEIGKGDDFLEEVLRPQLTSVKTSSKISSTATNSKENPMIAELAAIGLGGYTMTLDGADLHDIPAGMAAAYALSKGRGVMNKKFTNSVNKRSKKVEKALKGDLGALKSKHKQMQDFKKGKPDGSLLRAYLALENEE